MTPIISIIMGSTSDLPVMEKACKWLNDNEIPFEVNALSAHRTPEAVETFARNAKQRGIKVNAAILATEMIALSDEAIAAKVDAWKAGLGKKIEKANEDLKEVKYEYKCN